MKEKKPTRGPGRPKHPEKLKGRKVMLSDNQHKEIKDKHGSFTKGVRSLLKKKPPATKLRRIK